MTTMTLRTILAGSALALCLAAPAHAADGAVDEAAVEKIMAMLTDIECQMDEDDIERDGAGYELDDVFCADGQYDMVLDEDFEIVERRKE
ncbi:MAG: PepSY domain-containing protein [Pseudomonadota bacterium]